MTKIRGWAQVELTGKGSTRFFETRVSAREHVYMNNHMFPGRRYVVRRATLQVEGTKK